MNKKHKTQHLERDILWTISWVFDCEVTPMALYYAQTPCVVKIVCIVQEDVDLRISWGYINKVVQLNPDQPDHLLRPWKVKQISYSALKCKRQI